MKTNKQSVISNLLWKFAERGGSQGVSFVVSIVLARLLLPEEYGTIALVTVFTAILQVFIDSGLGNALIQKKDADDTDFSTVFYFNIFACTVLYLGLFICAPLIANFYDTPDLVPIVRVLGLTLVISGVKNIQQAYVSRHMIFKKFFYSNVGAILFSAVVGITMAYLGFGVWALVAQSLMSTLANTIILWSIIPWRPKRLFSFQRLKGLFSYGWKILVASLLDTVYNNLKSLLIGKVYSSEDLAYYTKGKQFPNLVITNINTSINSVLLPAMANVQDDVQRVKSMTRRAIRTSSYVIWPAMIGLSVCATPLIELLLTEKWLPAVPFLRIFCITYAFWPIHTANLNAIKALGRSDLFLKLEIIKKIVGVISILVTVNISVFAMALAGVVVAPISSFINAFPNKKLINYSYFEQIKDLMPSILLSVFMGFCIWWIQYLPISSVLILLIQVPMGAGIYLLGSIVFKLESFHYALDASKEFFARRKGKKTNG